MLKGLPEAVIAQVLRERITYVPGGRELVATMKAHGGHAALVSGGFTGFHRTGRAARSALTRTAPTRCSTECGKLTGEVARPILGREAKVAALNEIAGAARHRRGADAMAVGDGANDLGMLGAGGHGRGAARQARRSPPNATSGSTTAI